MYMQILKRWPQATDMHAWEHLDPSYVLPRDIKCLYRLEWKRHRISPPHLLSPSLIILIFYFFFTTHFVFQKKKKIPHFHIVLYMHISIWLNLIPIRRGLSFATYPWLVWMCVCPPWDMVTNEEIIQRMAKLYAYTHKYVSYTHKYMYIYTRTHTYTRLFILCIYHPVLSGRGN